MTELNLGAMSYSVTDQGITKLTNLTGLTVGALNRQITNNGIKQMVWLKKLVLHCGLTVRIDEEGISHLTNLEELFLNSKRIKTFEGFYSITTLKKLYLNNHDDISQSEYEILKAKNPVLNITWAHGTPSQQ